MPLNPSSQADPALINTICGSLLIAFPAVVVCTIVGYRKYRAMVVQWRIQLLNRLWQLESSKKLF